MITTIPGVHPSLLPEVLSTLDRLESRYPTVPILVKTQPGWKMGAREVVAETLPVTGEIWLNSDMWTNPAHMYHDLQMRTTEARTVGDYLVHEYSHAMLMHITESEYEWSLRTIQRLIVPAMARINPRTLEEAVKVYPISVYGIQGGPQEAIAECFVRSERGQTDEYAALADRLYSRLRRA